jgi:hypothetical protein
MLSTPQVDGRAMRLAPGTLHSVAVARLERVGNADPDD